MLNGLRSLLNASASGNALARLERHLGLATPTRACRLLAGVLTTWGTASDHSLRNHARAEIIRLLTRLETHTDNTTGRLIAAGRVSGTNVYNSANEKLGSIYEVMLDKKSGKADFAIMSFGGFLGRGRRTIHCRGISFAMTRI
jgi:hypothetical protein